MGFCRLKEGVQESQERGVWWGHVVSRAPAGSLGSGDRPEPRVWMGPKGPRVATDLPACQGPTDSLDPLESWEYLESLGPKEKKVTWE